MLSRRRFLGAAIAGPAVLASPRAFASVISGDRPTLLPRAMAALETHGRNIAHRDVVGIVDFAYPSTMPRFHLVDIGNGRTSTLLVAHGRGSDPANKGWVERLSNIPRSNASCGGSFVTGKTYAGKHGRSRYLDGLDAENNMAASRAIVIHAAEYVDADLARSQGRVGRSQGCFAVSRHDLNLVLSRLGEGRLLFAAK